ncbi:hypothetical protein [Parasitella parasitica]|uniref:Endonuclease/exonuclease/phosphatase domain-containing protein n=1 Tax=Parasitella parasitica TaxID=35722 RepID=A0A0B7N4K3_9FUNG|nr:hypothetical protein [Parasitella parasitica]
MNRSKVNIGSLNCRSLLSKSSNPSVSSEFCRYLRSLSLDILCIQESYATTDAQTRLNMQLQASSSLWTAHCGIVSFNPSLTLHSLDINLEQRIIACTVVQANALFPPITLINIYAPANYRQRLQFFNQVLTLPLFQHDNLHLKSNETYTADPDSSPSPSIIPMLIMGDFNFHAYAAQTDSNDYTTDTLPHSSPLDSSPSIPTHSQSRWHQFLSFSIL